MAWERKAVSGSVSGGRWGSGPSSTALPLGWERRRVSKQTSWQDCVGQARPHLLSWTCPLGPPPSFLADSEGHTGWGDSGGGGFGFASCLHDAPGPWSPLCCTPIPTSSPFSVATLGLQGFPGGSHSEESACSGGDPRSIPGLGRSPWGREWLPTPYSCLENSMNRGASWARVHGIAELDTTERLTLTFTRASGGR